MGVRVSCVLLALVSWLTVGCSGDVEAGNTPQGVACPPGAPGCAGPNMAAVPQCLPHERACFGACFDLSSSVQHCGACGVACGPGEVCEAGVCRNVCGPGLGFCGGQCISLASNPSHCGACNAACPQGQVCVAGSCSLSCPQTLCQTAVGTECVDLVDDRAHCGACNNACPQGDVCIDSACVLDCGALTACDDVCVDLQADDANCGSCGAACLAAKACIDGTCACPDGLTECGDACLDTTMDPEHCGGCDQACGAQESCEEGRCVGPDGCTNIPVSGLSLSQVAVYQSVKIPIMEELTAIGSAQRNADVVQQRDAVFRVHVSPEADWMPREVSARIELIGSESAESSGPRLFFDLATPAAASSDDDPNSAFRVAVPAEALTGDAEYSVTLVECGDGPTSEAAPDATTTQPAEGVRFPSDGYSPLEARETGPLRVHLVPIDSGGATPDVSDDSLEVYRARLLAMFPVTEVELTVGDPLASTASSMCNHLSALSARRSADNPPIDMYYYGLVSGVSGGQSGCSTAVPNARSTAKVSTGWHTVSQRDDGTTGAATMCHELGHAHGRLHAPCGVQDPDWNYPYPDADIGVWAYDSRSEEFMPPTRKDMMSYCPNPDRSLAWLSDYTYQAILDRVAEVNALTDRALIVQSDSGPRVPWRLLVVDDTGAHWGEYPLLVSGTPEGDPVSATIHDESGPIQQIEAYRVDLEDGASHEAFMLTVPEPAASWHAIEVPGLLPPQPF